MHHRRLLLQAALLALTVGQLHADPISRAEARRVAIDMLGADNVGADRATDDTDAFSPYYIFARANGKGFVIVSGDDSTAPILGYTEQGDFDEASLPVQLQGMLKVWRENISRVQQLKRSPRQRAPRLRAVAAYKKDWEDVPALIKTAWHQDVPYNLLAPRKNGVRCMTGCVATAGAQVTYYFHRDNPDELQYATPTYSYGTPVTESLPAGTPIEWNLMKLSGRGTLKQDSAVARLMYALGTSAWLTYGDGDGTATSGHNDKMAEAMKGQFHLNYQYKSKSGVSQEEWERLIYNNLKSRRPMLYSGYKDEATGGHSVVLDGYQASTGLYHFNFGWGGQGNGYYTVDDQTGMNGFNQYQDLVYNITPQVQSLAGSIQTATLYHKAPSTVSVEVTNTGTLDYSGFYFYANSQDKLPSRITASDTKTELVPDKPQKLTFTLTPTATGQQYLFLCDKHKNILDSRLVEVLPTYADLHVEDFSVDTGTEVMTVDDMSFGIINNGEAHVVATLTNGPQGTYCQPAFQCYLEQYDQVSKEWGNRKGIVINDIVFEQGQTQQAVFTFENLEEGNLYRAFLNEKVQATEASDLVFDTPVRTLYFTVRSSNLEVTVNGREATVTGRWNADLFREKAQDASVCSYDITGLTDLNSQPEAANPNALFYASAQSEGIGQLKNIVVGDQCEQLQLQTGYDFMPTKPFVARLATLVMPDAAAGNWGGVVVPFAVSVPYGMQIKAPAEWIDGSTVIVAYRHTLQVEAMTPIVYMTGHDALNRLTAENVSITTETSGAAFNDQLAYTTVEMPAEPTWLFLADNYGTLYYKADGRLTVPAFQSYVKSTTGKQMRTTQETALDGNYRSLSVSINKVYSNLADMGQQPSDASDALQAELRRAEDMLTYRQSESGDEVMALRDALDDALKDYLENGGQGIWATQSVPDSPTPVYYNLSGQQLQKPARGMNIERHGQRVRKVAHF